MKRLLPFIFFITLTVPFWDIGHPLWEVDDARYAEVPREMHESGDWLTPSLNYMDYVEKPPMIYWLGAISYRIFGVSEAASRVPLALLALLGILGVAWLGSWLYSPSEGLYAGLILGTCVQFCALSRLQTPDMAVSVCLLWATGFILRTLLRPQCRWSGSMAWLTMAAAFLSKGLIAVVFPSIWTVMLLLFFPRLRRGLRPLLLNWGLVLFALIIGGWFYAMERANPGFFHVFVIEQHFQRFLDTQKYNRPGPWYFFFGVDIIGTLPWTPLMVAGVLIPLFRWQKTDARDRYLALWAALIFLFFTRSSSKLITYILPLFAHQALLAGRLLTRIHRMPKIGRILKNTAVGLAALFLSAALIAPFLAPRLEIPVTIPQGLLWSGIAALCALAASQGFLARVQAETDHRNIAAGCALCALFVIAALTSGTGYLDHELSVKRLGTEISRRIKSLSDKRPIRILAYNKYLHGIPFYTRRPVDVVNWIGELHYAKRFDRFRPRFGDDQTIRSLPDKNAKVYVTVQKRDLKDYLELSPKKKMTQLTEIGPWMLVEY